MKNTYIMIVAALVLGVGGIGAYELMNRDTSMTSIDSMEKTVVMVKDDEVMANDADEVAKAEGAMMQKEEPTMADTDEIMMKKEEKYVPFSPEMLTSSANTRRVLFFYANWCPTCKPADASFTKNMSQIPADVTLIRVNYDDTETDQAEKELAKKYGVTYQHTFVQIDANGNEVTKWNGGQIDELLKKIK